MNIAHTTKKFIILSCIVLLTLTSCETQPGKSYRINGTLTIDGLQRSYVLNLPPHYYESEQVPVVIALHGTGGSALQCERDYGLTTKASAEGYIVVYPEGVPRPGPFGIRTWNAGTCCDYAVFNNIDDVQFIQQLIEEIIQNYKTDQHKIYIAGMSNGAMMAYRLACEGNPRIRAIATVSGTLVANRPCTPSNPISILHIHSTLDRVVPYEGGLGLGGYHFPSVDSTLQVFMTLNQCTNAIDERFQNYDYRRSHCSNGATIERYLTKDGGHSWPGGLQARAGADEPSLAIHATEIVFEFFKQH